MRDFTENATPASLPHQDIPWQQEIHCISLWDVNQRPGYQKWWNTELVSRKCAFNIEQRVQLEGGPPLRGAASPPRWPAGQAPSTRAGPPRAAAPHTRISRTPRSAEKLQIRYVRAGARVQQCCCPPRGSHLVQVKFQIKSSFRYTANADANLAPRGPARPPQPPQPYPPRSGLIFSLDIILENDSHATNTPGIFQLHIFYGGITVSLPASK